jgi:hypothetical protein
VIERGLFPFLQAPCSSPQLGFHLELALKNGMDVE